MDRSKLYDYSDGSRFLNKSAKEIFSEIEKRNVWHEKESVSGSGSSLVQTKTIIEVIPKIIRELGIKTIFDIPCGDFNWFKEINLSSNIYLGGDIVKDIVDRNNQKYRRNNINFVQFNILEDIQETMDLVFCRDCLVHFSTMDIWKALSNIQKSNSRYLMTTTFTREVKNNDIVTGGWRPLNLIKKPFNFPKPLLIVNENCTEKDGIFRDKSLALWKIKELVLKQTLV
ncbi:MAG: class I SAM-dependent methyltransferase [Deferribacteres bacterium]|nr:class I SAM-dependent methyltransferase [candidate division KSB1 bacterium]MCB9503952.1 class I SAM-dependent methyltransferase [Deferribacteres bacterium]